MDILKRLPGHSYFVGEIFGVPIIAIYYFAAIAFLAYVTFSYFASKQRYGKFLYTAY